MNLNDFYLGGKYELLTCTKKEIAKDEIIIIKIDYYNKHLVAVYLDRIDGCILPIDKVIVDKNIIYFYPD